MTVPGKTDVEDIWVTKKNLPSLGKVLRHVQLYREQERGSNTEEQGSQSLSVPRSLVGAVFYLDAAPPPPNFKVIPATQSDSAIPQAPGRSVRQSWGRPVKHWLEPAKGRRPVKVR